MTTKHIIAALTCFAGCVDANVTDTNDTNTTRQEVAITSSALVNATTTFTDAVALGVRNVANEKGLPLTSAVATGYTPRNTIGSAASATSQLFFVGRSFRTTTMKPGLYQIKPSSSGAVLYRYEPTGGQTLLGPIQKPTPALGDAEWMCENAPDLIHEFCTTFVWCAMFDVGCGGLPGATWVG